MKEFFGRSKELFQNLIYDIKMRQLTNRVKVFTGCVAAVILCVALCVAAGYKKDNGDNVSKAELIQDAGTASQNASSKERELSFNELDKDYDKDANVVDEDKYKDTVLQSSEDAGDEYINDTLFIGDSNTVRMMNYGYTTTDNTLAVVGMGIQSVKTLKCIEFTGYSAPVTMIEAVKLMQPRRIIITFGTNNATGMDTDTFIKKYNEAIDALEEAYPYADILINSIPPFAKMNSYPKLSIISVDKFNVALNELANKRKLKFINSASVMKDNATGYAKEGFMAGDGIHITGDGFDAMFKYIRTHSHIVEDTRPKPLKAIPKQKKATYVIGGDGKMRNDKASYEKMSVDPSAAAGLLNKQTPAASSSSSSSSSQPEHIHKFGAGSITKEPTFEEAGIKEYKCSECGYIYAESIPKLEKPVENKKTDDKSKPQPNENVPDPYTPPELEPSQPAPPVPAPDPTPSNPTPSEPAPSEPAPSEPTPSDPAPSKPALSEPTPEEPSVEEPSDPAPPSNNEPSEPAPEEPVTPPPADTPENMPAPPENIQPETPAE